MCLLGSWKTPSKTNEKETCIHLGQWGALIRKPIFDRSVVNKGGRKHILMACDVFLLLVDAFLCLLIVFQQVLRMAKLHVGVGHSLKSNFILGCGHHAHLSAAEPSQRQFLVFRIQ